MICKECLEDKPLEEYYKQTSGTPKTTCKRCYLDKCKEYQKRNPHVARKASRKYKAKVVYNITLEEYDSAMETSVHCEVCESTTELVYDHNHETGEFRGVLCRSCNLAEGNLKGDYKIALKLAEYMKR